MFDNVTNDLLSSKYEVNSIMVQNKWNSLMKSYRKAKDNKNKTGRAPSRFHFFTLIDEVVGTSPSNLCSHAINSYEMGSPDAKELPAGNNNNELDETVVDGNINRSTPKSSKRQRVDYMEFKREEAEKKQKWHDERINLEREKLILENRKLDLLQQYLNLKHNT